MRDTAFIICEYNPFHNGHLRHVQLTRAAGAQRVICIMSGNFVQRGDIAFCDKVTRAGFAAAHGADLVLELPLKYVLSGAPYFAKGAFEVIREIGLSGTVSFGASASSEKLNTLAQLSVRADIKAEIQAYSQLHGVHYAAAFSKIVGRDQKDLSGVLNDPNNILALEYMKAAMNSGADTDFYAVPRGDVTHDSQETSADIAGAKYIREMIYRERSAQNAKPFLPPDVYEIIKQGIGNGYLPADREKFAVAAMARLISLTEDDFRMVNGVNQGLENRISDALKNCSDLYMLFDRIKTKRFTHARIRQILVSAALDIKKTTLERENPYIRVLGMNDTGKSLIKEIRARTDVPLIMNLSEAPLCVERTLDAFSGKLFDLCRLQPLHKSPEYSAKPYVAS